MLGSSSLLDPDRREDVTIEVSFFRAKVDYFQVDTSEFEDLFDNAGENPALDQPTRIAPGLAELSSSERQFPNTPGNDEIASLESNAWLFGGAQQISAFWNNTWRSSQSHCPWVILSLPPANYKFTLASKSLLTKQLPHSFVP